MRRKSKSSKSVGASVNGDDGSELSKSSKKSFVSKLMKRKDKKKSSKRDTTKSQNDVSTTAQAKQTKDADAQKSFMKQEEKKPYMLKIALLLVDAKTRRFELLQLEFDSDKALVSDALSQIPIHVTEKVLSSQSYTGVCGASGTEKKKSVALFDFCKGNDVLVAIPSGTSADECARLAKPILSDEKVVGMLSTSGINADPWTTAPLAAPRSMPKGRTASRPRGESDKTGSSTTTIFYILIGIIIMAALAFLYTTMTNSSSDSGDGSEGWTTPQMNMDSVWSSCHRMCDASQGVFEKIVAPSSTKEE